MSTYSFDLDNLLDMYKSDDWRLVEVIKSMRDYSQKGTTILIERTFDNAPAQELNRLQNIGQLNDWLSKTFPKRIFYQYVNVERSTLDFILVKSSEVLDKYSVELKKRHNNNRLIIVGRDSNRFVLLGTNHDINNFSVQEDFDSLDWRTSFITDPNQSYT